MAYRFLVVEDSIPMRAVLIKIIKTAGYSASEFFEAANGIEALEIMSNEWIDLVLTDYNMPDMDGMELLSRMQNNEELKKIPALVVTTEGSERRIREFLEMGAKGYIKKPFTPEELNQMIVTIMGEPEDDGEIEDSDEGFDF